MGLASLESVSAILDLTEITAARVSFLSPLLLHFLLLLQSDHISFLFLSFHFIVSLYSLTYKSIRGILAVTMITAASDQFFLFPLPSSPLLPSSPSSFIFFPSSHLLHIFHLLLLFLNPHHLKSISAIPAALMAAWHNFFSFFLSCLLTFPLFSTSSSLASRVLLVAAPPTRVSCTDSYSSHII